MIKNLLHKYGALRTTVFLSVVCIVASLLITATIWEVLGLQNLDFALLVGFVCPTLVAPPTIISFCRLSESLQKSRLELEEYKDHLEERVAERTRDLQQALAELRVLKGILPICSHCKMVRDEEGNWNQIDEYIRKHSEAEFSHGVCPDCLEKYYPED